MVQISKWKAALILAILIVGVIFAAPNFLVQGSDDRVAAWLPDSRVNLGLDLQGGSHLLYEVDLNGPLEKRFTALREDLDAQFALLSIETSPLRIDGGAASFALADPDRAEQVRGILRSAGGRDRLDVEVTPAGIVTIRLAGEELQAFERRLVDQSIEVIRRRVDDLGTREATILRQGDDRILVQVPGVEDPKRLKCIIGKTGRLTFQLVNATVQAPEAAAVPLPPSVDECDRDALPTKTPL
jgi:preprotein translocase subunit SecD